MTIPGDVIRGYAAGGAADAGGAAGYAMNLPAFTLTALFIGVTGITDQRNNVDMAEPLS